MGRCVKTTRPLIHLEFNLAIVSWDASHTTSQVHSGKCEHAAPYMAWVRSLNGFPEREVNSILKVHYLYPSAISLYSNPTPPAPSAATSSGYPLQHS